MLCCPPTNHTHDKIQRTQFSSSPFLNFFGSTGKLNQWGNPDTTLLAQFGEKIEITSKILIRNARKIVKILLKNHTFLDFCICNRFRVGWPKNFECHFYILQHNFFVFQLQHCKPVTYNGRKLFLTIKRFLFSTLIVRKNRTFRYSEILSC